MSKLSKSAWKHWMAGSGLAVCLGLGLTPTTAGAALPLAVQTDAGWLEGMKAETGNVYLGIPFAAPPVGPLRWKAPMAVRPWQGVRSARQAGPSCTQDAALPPAGVAGSNEDCLYLNVHVPVSAKVGSALPVMVWVHGGAYLTGSGSQYDGDRLAESAQAVVVTINYRLGIFGMLALNALSQENRAGNQALQDQQAALRWVKRNIARFGGDAARVTLFGQSAGGASVCQQLVSPMAAGLFHRAIIQSGPCTFGTAPLDKALATGTALAQKLGCAPGATQLTCMRSKSTDEVFRAAPTLDFNDVTTLQVITPWVDGVVLPDHPKNLVSKGRINRVPVMLGSTQDEGRLFVALGYETRRGTPLTEQEYQDLVTKVAGSATIAAAVTLDYSSKRLGSPNLAASALVTDGMFACGTQWSARRLANLTPTYVYEFQDQQVPQLIADPFMPWGAYHASELPFLFQSRILTNPASPDPRNVASAAQLRLSAQMARYWGRFAATGNPNGGTDVNWPRVMGLTPSAQLFKTPAVQSTALSSLYSQHQCLLWDTAASVGIGL